MGAGASASSKLANKKRPDTAATEDGSDGSDAEEEAAAQARLVLLKRRRKKAKPEAVAASNSILAILEDAEEDDEIAAARIDSKSKVSTTLPGVRAHTNINQSAEAHAVASVQTGFKKIDPYFMMTLMHHDEEGWTLLHTACRSDQRQSLQPG
jgi:hypothetical protein